MKRGQAVVVVMLMLGVLLTVGLSIASRSITEVNVSSVQDESARALQAAEAGVERSVGGVIVGSGTHTGYVSSTENFTVVNSNVGETNSYQPLIKLENGDALTVNMNPFSGSQVRVCWGNNTSVSHPAVEVSMYSVSGTNARVVRQVYDPDAASRGNGFDLAQGGGPCGSLDYNTGNMHMSDLVPAGFSPAFMRIRMLYNDVGVPQPVLVRSSGGDIPVQGTDIVSAGQSGGVSQKVHAVKLNPDMPPMFDNAIFSGTDLVQ